jgi:hypothetical protein
VDDRVSRPHRAWARRLAAAAAWTLALGALMLGLDRLALGPDPPRGWTAAAAVEDVPEDAGPVLVPAYLPEDLGWPPASVVYWAGGGRGWWLEVRARRDAAPWLYLGSGERPAPESVPLAAAGDPHWRRLSRRVGGQAVVLVTRLPPGEALRVLDGLEPAGAGP